MKINLQKSTEKEKDFVGANVYRSVKNRLDELSNTTGLTLAQIIRTAINDLIDKEA